MQFGIGKSCETRSVETCCACRTARRVTFATTSANRTTRAQGRRHSVDRGGHVHLTSSRSCPWEWDWCKSRAQNTKLVHANTTASSPSAMLEQARLDALVTTGSTRSTRRTCRVVTWLKKWNLDLYSLPPAYDNRHLWTDCPGTGIISKPDGLRDYFFIYFASVWLYVYSCATGSEEYRTRNAAMCIIDKECPSECSCDGTVIHCNALRLTQLPDEFPSYATEM